MVYRRKGREGWWFHVDDPATGRQRQFKCEGISKRKAAMEASEFKAQLRKQFVPASPEDFNDFILRDYWPSPAKPPDSART